MNRRSLWIVSLAVVALAGSALVYAGWFDEESNQNVNVQFVAPGGGECYCPQIWRPVVCVGEDNMKHYFSNACVAGCAGYTRCREVRLTLAP